MVIMSPVAAIHAAQRWEAAMRDNTENTDDDSAGFADLIDHARLMGWLCLFGFVGFLIWLALR